MTTPIHNPHWRRNLAVCLFGSFTTITGMTLIMPILPIYVAELGVTSQVAIVRWSGVAFGVTFLMAALAAPFWGRLADRHGRKLTLVRAGLGMSIAMPLTGLAQDVWQLVLVRVVVGLVGGYASGAVVFVASQTPKERVGWALGVLSTGVLAGNIAGPLAGGFLTGWIGIRQTFLLAGAVIFIAFLATVLLINDVPSKAKLERADRPEKAGLWSRIPDRVPVIAMLVTAFLLLFANMSIEPIITLFMARIVEPQSAVVMMSGIVMAAAAFASIVSAPSIGWLGDRVGHWRVVAICLLITGFLLIPQAYARTGWEMVAWRFLMGVALAGLLPAVTSLIRHSVRDEDVGLTLGYSQSAQYLGQILGPLSGGYVGGAFGPQAVFFMTAGLLLVGAAMNTALIWHRVRRRIPTASRTQEESAS
jgi:MFS family permease